MSKVSSVVKFLLARGALLPSSHIDVCGHAPEIKKSELARMDGTASCQLQRIEVFKVKYISTRKIQTKETSQSKQCTEQVSDEILLC